MKTLMEFKDIFDIYLKNRFIVYCKQIFQIKNYFLNYCDLVVLTENINGKELILLEQKEFEDYVIYNDIEVAKSKL